MNTTLKEYPQLGQEVAYVRYAGKDEGFVERTGIVMAIALDHQSREVVNILERIGSVEPDDKTQERVNVDLRAINPSDEYVSAYKIAVEAELSYAKEGNDKVQEVVAEYNKLIDSATAGVYGEPVKIGQ